MQVNKINYSITPNKYPFTKKNSPQLRSSNYSKQPDLNVNFTGLNFPKVSCLFVSKSKRNSINHFKNSISDFLSIKPNEAEKYVTPHNHKRMSFFYALSERYRSEKYMHPEQFAEISPDTLYNIYEKIRNPHRYHFAIIQNSKHSFADVIKLLDLSTRPGNSTLLKMLHGSLKEDSKLSLRELNSLLAMKNTKKLADNFSQYRSYIILNSGKPDFVENLSKELAAPKISFNPEILDKKVAINKAKRGAALLENLSEKEILENYSAEGLKLLSAPYSIVQNLVPKDTALSKENKDLLVYLLKTTNSKNLKDRQIFLTNNLPSYENSNADIKRFFETLDNNKYFSSLYQKVRKQNSLLFNRPIKDLMFYADSFGAEVLLKKSDSFFRILRLNNNYLDEPEIMRKIISKNLNNKFYINRKQVHSFADEEYYMRVSDMVFGNIKANIRHAKRAFKYKVMPKIFGTGSETPVINNVKYIKNSEQITVTRPQVKPDSQVSKKESMPVVQPKVKIKRDYAAQKLEIKKEAMEIISRKMNSKKDYSLEIKNFTKMRNELLSDMFSSVLKTQRLQRANGQKVTVSKRDVIKLYSKINGKNKNIVKYMLNKRKADGNPEFDIKQVIQVVDAIASKRPPVTRTSVKVSKVPVSNTEVA